MNFIEESETPSIVITVHASQFVHREQQDLIAALNKPGLDDNIRSKYT